MANQKLVQGKTLELHVYGLDGAGNFVPADPSVLPTWSLPIGGDAGKLGLVPSPDGNTCTVTGVTIATGLTVRATATAGHADFLIDVVSGAVVSVAIVESQGPGNVDVRQLSAGGRYLGLGFGTAPNA